MEAGIDVGNQPGATEVVLGPGTSSSWSLGGYSSKFIELERNNKNQSIEKQCMLCRVRGSMKVRGLRSNFEFNIFANIT